MTESMSRTVLHGKRLERVWASEKCDNARTFNVFIEDCVSAFGNQTEVSNN